MDDFFFFFFFAELHHYLDLSMFYSGGEMFESHSDECRTLKGEDFALQYFSRSPKLNSKLFFFFFLKISFEPCQRSQNKHDEGTSGYKWMF